MVHADCMHLHLHLRVSGVEGSTDNSDRNSATSLRRHMRHTRADGRRAGGAVQVCIHDAAIASVIPVSAPRQQLHLYAGDRVYCDSCPWVMDCSSRANVCERTRSYAEKRRETTKDSPFCFVLVL